LADHKILIVQFSERTFDLTRKEFAESGLTYVERLDDFAGDPAEITAALGNIGSRSFIEEATSLEWIQAFSAGVNQYPFQTLKDRGIVLTNAARIYGPNIADHMMALALMLCRQIEPIRRDVLNDGWPKKKRLPNPGELEGQTMLVVGLGGIGDETAKRAAGLGMRVVATRRQTDRPIPDYVEAVHHPDALHRLLPEADWVAVCVPYTDDTIDLISTEEFSLMKPGAHILCATRGGIISTDALMAALDSGRLAGAGLDVTDPEPLPLDHPLWQYETVIITPHQSGYSEAANRRLEDMIRRNIRSFLKGEPLENVVDLNLQY